VKNPLIWWAAPRVPAKTRNPPLRPAASICDGIPRVATADPIPPATLHSFHESECCRRSYDRFLSFGGPHRVCQHKPLARPVLWAVYSIDPPLKRSWTSGIFSAAGVGEEVERGCLELVGRNKG